MVALLILFCIFININFGYSYLTSNQWRSINSIIRSDIESSYKMKVRKIMFVNYYAYTIKKSKEFILKNNKLLKNLNKREIINYGILGLNNACIKYSGNTNFNKYLDLYVKGTLYKGVSDIKPMSIIPHHLRINKKWRSENLSYYIKNINNIQFAGNDDYVYDKYYYNNIENESVKETTYNYYVQKIKNVVNKKHAYISPFGVRGSYCFSKIIPQLF